MKKVIIFGLLLVVVIVFSACGNGGGGAVAGDAGAAGAEAAPAGDNGGDAVAGTGAVNPPGVFPIVDDPITISVFSRHIGWVADFVDNRFTEWYEELTNIRIDWHLVSEADVDTRLNLMLAAGDLTDVIMDPWAITNTQLMVFGEQGLFIPLNDLIERYGIETRRILSEFPTVRDMITQSDGNIYALPHIDMCYHCWFPNKMWVYEPWLDTLGLAKPTNINEFADMLRAFRDGDPNGNGLDDIVPFAGTMSSGAAGLPSIAVFIMNSFIYTDDTHLLKVDNGVLVPVFNTPEWREGLRYLQMLHDEGLLSAETFTQDGAQMQALNGGDHIRLGAFPSLVAWAALPGGPAHPEWTNYVPIAPLTGPTGLRQARHNVFDTGPFAAFIITSSNPHPEASFRWADAKYDMEITMRKYYGRIGYEIRFAEDGEIGINGLPAIWTILTESGAEHDQPNHAAWAHVGVHARSADFRHGQTVPPDMPNHTEKILYLATRDYYEPFAPPFEIIQPPQFFTEQQANDLMDLTVTINNHVAEMFALFIIGAACLDNDWDTYVQTLDAMGLDRFMQIHQEAFDARWR